MVLYLQLCRHQGDDGFILEQAKYDVGDRGDVGNSISSAQSVRGSLRVRQYASRLKGDNSTVSLCTKASDHTKCASPYLHMCKSPGAATFYISTCTLPNLYQRSSIYDLCLHRSYNRQISLKSYLQVRSLDSNYSRDVE